MCGLQRTGTNLVQRLIQQNFHVRSRERKAFWKHGRVDYYPMRDPDTRPVVFFVCTKNPYAWLDSWFRYAKGARGHDAGLRESGVNGKTTIEDCLRSETYEFINPIQRWNQLNWHWLNLSSDRRRLQVVRSEDLLSHEQQRRKLIQIHTETNLQRITQEWYTEGKRVGYGATARGNDFDWPHYREQKYLGTFNPENLEFINENLDRTLMEYLGYDLVTSEQS